MDQIASESLDKPDMVAVLSRTHLAKDIHSFLMPIFEAISNAIDGIENRFLDGIGEGRIDVVFQSFNHPKNFFVSVTDNGVGFTEENFKSFRTPISGYKLKRKGRGFGRFIAFKVFGRVHYSSWYLANTLKNARTFRFNIFQSQEFTIFDGEPDFRDLGVRVEYNEPLADWNELIPKLTSDDILAEIGNHFLPYFLHRPLPTISVQFDGGEKSDITTTFRNSFSSTEAGKLQCEIDGLEETLEYSIAHVPRNSKYKSHSLLFAAADRIVGSPRDLSEKLGEPFFQNDKGEKYIVIAVVRGDAFETRLNDSRTGINLSPKTIETIVKAVSDAIQVKETNQIQRIKRQQSGTLNVALREHPTFRLGLRGQTVDEYVRTKPNNWGPEEFVSDLAVNKIRANRDLNNQLSVAASSPDEYEKHLKDVVSKLDSAKKEALAEYVIHRTKIIELVEAARRFDEHGKIPPEDIVHDLVFRRFTDTAKLNYFQHNLWLIDDLLAFTPYATSDRNRHGAKRVQGSKVSDIAIFDDSLVLGDTDGPTLSIVEFKRPKRDDYSFGSSKSDPIMQVVETFEKAEAEGGIERTDGNLLTFGSISRRFGFIIADVTPSLVKVLKAHDFRNQWDPSVYIRYRDNESILIQVFGYQTLVSNAKKRNQAFSAVLLGE